MYNTSDYSSRPSTINVPIHLSLNIYSYPSCSGPQAIASTTSRRAERKLDDVLVPTIWVTCTDLPYSQEAEGHARNREPTTDRADVGTQQFA